jgi:hypothetical protein
VVNLEWLTMKKLHRSWTSQKPIEGLMQSVNKGISKPYPQLVMTYPKVCCIRTWILALALQRSVQVGSSDVANI